MAISAEQRRRLEEQARKQREATSKSTAKPPAVGSKRADGKVYSGQNYGYQSAGSHNKLKQDGKFKHGAQALDRVSQTVSRFIPQPVKDYAKGVAATAAKTAEQERKAQEKHPVGRALNRLKAQPNATERTLQGISDKTNVDRRITDTAVNLATAAVSKAALKKGVAKGATQPRSVGAAGRPAPNPARPQPGARLGGPNQKLEFQRTYHGTSARDAKSIRENGYRPSATGVFGNNQVYTGNKDMAKTYAKSAGVRAGDEGRVLTHRVPKKNQTTVPFEKPQNRERVSPQAGLVQQRLREGKTTRIDYGKGSQVTPLTKAQADKTLVKPNGQLRVTQAQADRLKASRVSPNKTQATPPKKATPKNFTPGRRALAVQRANSRMAVRVDGKAADITNNSIGLGGNRMTSRHGSSGANQHVVAFHNSEQKLRARGLNKYNPEIGGGYGPAYATRAELGDAIKSKLRQKINEAGLKDMMGRLLDIPKGDDLVSSPTSRGRASLYRRATKGAHGTKVKGSSDALRSTRTSPDIWQNHNDDRKIRFDPKSLSKELQKLIDSKTVRQGRRAGGTSRINANGPKVKGTITDNKAKSQRVAKGQVAAAKKAETKRIASLSPREAEINGLRNLARNNGIDRVGRGNSMTNTPGVLSRRNTNSRSRVTPAQRRAVQTNPQNITRASNRRRAQRLQQQASQTPATRVLREAANRLSTGANKGRNVGRRLGGNRNEPTLRVNPRQRRRAAN